MKANHILIILWGFLPVTAMKPAAPLQKEPLQPNIIVFLIDDMGWMDSSVPFGDSSFPLNKQFHTPNMERLAREGMLFSRAYTQPVCTPSRSALLTGIHPARSHITNWVNTQQNTPTDYPDSALQTPDWNINGLSPIENENSFTAALLPQLLRDAGYHTIHVGKAHWGSQGTPGADPLNMGFDTQVAGSSIGHPQSFYGKENFGNIPGATTGWAVTGLQEFHGKDMYLTESLTRKALQLLEQPIKEKRPFLLNLSHYAVHIPIQPDKKFLKKYLAAGLDSTEAAYATMVEGMDESLGMVMAFLNQKNIADQTVILFLSDNGGLSAVGRGGKKNTHNLPLRSGKGSVYEGGIRIPMIVKWPGHTQGGSRTKQPVSMEDIVPTLLEMAQAAPPGLPHKIDGNSLVPLLENKVKEDTNKNILIHYPHRWTVPEEEGIAWTSGLIRGNWKIVYLMKKRQLELYHLENDLGEHHDLSASHPEQLKKMALLLTEALQTHNAQMPSWKATGQPVDWPHVLVK